MPGRPVDEETRVKVRAAHAEGKSRNAIAKEFGLAGQTVTRICAEEGLTFDRSQTELAVRARSIDLAAERLQLASEMVVTAREGLAALDGPYEVYNIGGKDNTFTSAILDGPPQDVRSAAMRDAGIAFDKLTRVVERDNGGLDEAVGILDSLADGFRAAADKYRGETADAAG